jgi:large subunit ribosomal protein L27
MAHKKGQGTSRNGRDSNSQRRGIKVYAGQTVTAGSILVRQCGSLFRAGFNVGVGRDDTLYSRIAGVVKYEGGRRVSVYAEAPVPAAGRS